MAESLSRHLTALGLTALGQDLNVANTHADLLIVDADNQHEYLRVRAAEGTQTPPLLVIASSAEIESRRFDGLLAGACIVVKPVQRATLAEAVAAALGLAPAPVAVAALLSAPAAIGGHVLLVEDEAVNAAVAQGYLEALGCTWVWVKDGPQAVARSAVERFDLILMDLSMPTMDGYATTALIRQRAAPGPRIPIVALSAHDAATYRATCLEAGMDDMLSKPYTLDACAQLLHRWLRPRGAPELSAIDPKTVASLRNLRSAGSEDLYSKLVVLFESGSAEALTALELALARAESPAAAALCHKLKASAANVGALAFSGELGLLEKACDAANLVEARRLHARVRTAYPALLAELCSLTLRASA
jgi:hypothetical protein